MGRRSEVESDYGPETISKQSGQSSGSAQKVGPARNFGWSHSAGNCTLAP